MANLIPTLLQSGRQPSNAGSYTSMKPSVPQSPPKATSKSRFVVWRLSMIPIIFVVPVLHHFFNRYLNERPINSLIVGQSVVKGAANTIGFAAGAVFSIPIAQAWAQRFWYTTTKTPLSLRELDATFDTLNSKTIWFKPWYLLRSKLVALIALLSLIAPFLSSSVTPSSLVVRGATSVQSTCNLPAVDLSERSLAVIANNGAYGSEGIEVTKLAYEALTTGHPLAGPIPSECGTGCAAYSYKVRFSAPTWDCQQLQDELSPFDPQNARVDLVWSSNLTGPSTAHQSDLAYNGELASTDNYFEVWWACASAAAETCHASCQPYDSTVIVEVSSESSVQTLSYEVADKGSPLELPSGTSPANNSNNKWAISDAVASVLLGQISVGLTVGENAFNVLPNSFDLRSTAYLSNFFNISTNTGYIGLDGVLSIGDVIGGLESLMLNSSVSMLSLSDLSKKLVECSLTSSDVVYSYAAPTILLATYGGLIFACIVAICIGIAAYQPSDCEQDATDFSRVLLSGQSHDMLNRMANVQGKDEKYDRLTGQLLQYNPASSRFEVLSK